jgi:hypothetical protein
MDQLQTRLEVLERQMCLMNRRLRWWRGLAGGLLALAVLTWALPLSTAQEGPRSGEQGLAQRVAALEDLLKHFSRKGNEIFITGANLHIVNGLNSTDCFDDEGNEIANCPNGLGNLIVGYNEPRVGQDVENIRTGSHNVVVGQQHNFSRFGGLVVGTFNTISGDFAVVSGGADNTASGPRAAVYGGVGNTASGDLFGNAVVSGGGGNTASGDFSTVFGGVSNFATGEQATIYGGQQNTAGGSNSMVYGGFRNTTSGENGLFSAIYGGTENITSGESAAVYGGQNNTASGILSVVSGGLGNTASGNFSSVSGGQNITQDTAFGWSAGSEADEVVVGNFRSP